jgi:hypothetical protein
VFFRHNPKLIFGLLGNSHNIVANFSELYVWNKKVQLSRGVRVRSKQHGFGVPMLDKPA